MSTKQPIWPSGRFGVPQITPFTYRDGHTHMELIEALREHLVERLHPSLVSTVDRLVEQMEAEYGKALDQYVNGVEEFQRIHDRFMSDVNATLMALNDSAVADLVGDDSTLLRQSLANVFVSHTEQNQRKIIATDPRYGTPYTLDSIYRALDHAEELGRGTVVEFPAGTYDVENGLDLSGYSAQLRGDGATGTSNSDNGGTTFYASTQRGPVLDFTNWVHPPQFLGKAIVGGFRVRGSGEVDITKTNVGLRFALVMSTTFQDIVVEETGGACLYGSNDRQGATVYLCDFERITLKTPIEAGRNDVPYAHFHGANGNRFRTLQLRSLSGSNNCGVSGAVIFEGDGRYRTSHNYLDAPWVEYMKVPSNGTIFRITDGTGFHLSNPYLVDVSREPGAQNSSYVTLDESGDYQSRGGNLISGVISGSSTYESGGNVGVKVLQNRNRIAGVKGYRGNNVLIGEGVSGTYVELAGGVATATDPGIIDHSGNKKNTKLDHMNGSYEYAEHYTSSDRRYSIAGKVVVASTRYDPMREGDTIEVDCSQIDTYELSLQGTGGSRDMVIHNAVDGATVTLLIRQSGPTTQINWPSGIRWVGEAPVLNGAGGSPNIVQLRYSAIGGWFEISRNIPA